jgi:hypothetical protein
LLGYGCGIGTHPHCGVLPGFRFKTAIQVAGELRTDDLKEFYYFQKLVDLR